MTTNPNTTTDGDSPDEDDDEQIDRELFERAVDELAAAEETSAELRDEIRALETGLTRGDTVALLYGRRNSLTKTSIESAFSTLEDISSTSDRTLLKRLLADLGEINQTEADAFLEEVDRLRTRYGDGGDR